VFTASKCNKIGFLITENDNCLVIARDLMKEDNKACGIMHIPKGWIDNIQILKKDA
jgi:hypothetical protein